jgi:hypothetical protein
MLAGHVKQEYVKPFFDMGARVLTLHSVIKSRMGALNVKRQNEPVQDTGAREIWFSGTRVLS